MHCTSCNYRPNYFYCFIFLFIVFSVTTASKLTQTLSLTSSKLYQLHLLNAFVFFYTFLGINRNFFACGRRRRSICNESRRRSSCVVHLERCRDGSSVGVGRWAVPTSDSIVCQWLSSSQKRSRTNFTRSSCYSEFKI